VSKPVRFIIFCLLIAGQFACTFGVPIGDRNDQTSNTSLPKTQKSKLGNPSSYVVFGERYYVLDSAEGFAQRGIASWYGTKFHGRKTSSGEIYDMHAMTAAHKTLPIPVYVRVDNLENGRSLVVKVNDRGPFVEGRIIDLSFAAAKKLGVDVPGTAKVEITVVSGQGNTKRSVVRIIPLTDQTREDDPLFVQLGSFSSQINAVNLSNKLKQNKEKAVLIKEIKSEGELFFRVRIGPLYDLDEANAVVSRLKSKGFGSMRIVVDE
jgi:rare lipoprotein A